VLLRDRPPRHSSLPPSVLFRPTSNEFSPTRPSASSAICFSPAALAIGAGIFHLMTHAFFKALLFLARFGHHAMGGEQDMRTWAASARKIKVITGPCDRTLAMQVFRRSRIFSKTRSCSVRLLSRQGGYALYAIGLLTAAHFFLHVPFDLSDVSTGKQRYDEHHRHVHESP